MFDSKTIVDRILAKRKAATAPEPIPLEPELDEEEVLLGEVVPQEPNPQSKIKARIMKIMRGS